MKNFSDQYQKIKGRKSSISLLRGATIKIVDNHTSHNYGSVGSIITLDDRDFACGASSLSGGIVGGNTINFNEFIIVTDLTEEDINTQIKEAEEEIEKSQTTINELVSKLEYLKETKKTTLVETEYKVYTAFKLLDNKKLSKKEKTEMLTKLITE